MSYIFNSTPLWVNLLETWARTGLTMRDAAFFYYIDKLNQGGVWVMHLKDDRIIEVTLYPGDHECEDKGHERCLHIFSLTDGMWIEVKPSHIRNFYPKKHD